jgi:ubiquinone/menaquinone biosynthesis C-methylase UbiE
MAHKQFPTRLAFLLNNPIRSYISPPGELISNLQIISGAVVVDFGCGPGFLTVPISKVAGRTIGIDISTEMLERAAKYAKKKAAKIEFLQSDGMEIKLPEVSVDLVLLNHVFHEIENQTQALKEFQRILRISGRLAIIEKTKGNRRLSKFLGPPTINESEVIRSMDESGFKHMQTTPYRGSSIIVGAKI